jgi:hypothetical protein
MNGAQSEVGTGINLFAAGEVRGVARWFNDTSDVLSVDDDELDETIAFVHKGGMTLAFWRHGPRNFLSRNARSSPRCGAFSRERRRAMCHSLRRCLKGNVFPFRKRC